MAQPKTKITGKKRKGKIVLTQRARVVKKGSGSKTKNLPLAPTRMVADSGANFRVRIKRK